MRLDLRFRLEEIPVPVIRPRGCLYWTGDPVYLSTGPEPGSADLGAAQNGDDIFWEHDLPETPAGWTFVSVYLDGQLLSLGWAEALIDTASCGAIVDETAVSPNDGSRSGFTTAAALETVGSGLVSVIRLTLLDDDTAESLVI